MLLFGQMESFGKKKNRFNCFSFLFETLVHSLKQQIMTLRLKVSPEPGSRVPWVQFLAAAAISALDHAFTLRRTAGDQ